jgi:hypothetical protein
MRGWQGGIRAACHGARPPVGLGMQNLRDTGIQERCECVTSGIVGNFGQLEESIFPEDPLQWSMKSMDNFGQLEESIFSEDPLQWSMKSMDLVFSKKIKMIFI